MPVTTVMRSAAGLVTESGDSGTSIWKLNGGSSVFLPFSVISMGDRVMSAYSTSETFRPNQSESATSMRATPPEIDSERSISGR